MQSSESISADTWTWADWQPASFPAIAERPSRWRQGLLAMIAAAHALLLFWPYGSGVNKTAVMEPDAALQVTFLVRPAVVPTSPDIHPVLERTDDSAPIRRKARKVASDTSVVTRDAPITQDDSTAILLLHLPDDLESASPFAKSRNPLERHAALPSEQAKTYMPGVRLRPGPSPSQVVEAIGALLFGAAKIDQCEKARLQLANMQANDDPQDRQDALSLRERYCRP